MHPPDPLPARGAGEWAPRRRLVKNPGVPAGGDCELLTGAAAGQRARFSTSRWSRWLVRVFCHIYSTPDDRGLPTPIPRYRTCGTMLDVGTPPRRYGSGFNGPRAALLLLRTIAYNLTATALVAPCDWAACTRALRRPFIDPVLIPCLGSLFSRRRPPGLPSQ